MAKGKDLVVKRAGVPVKGKDLKGRRAIVTGAGRGIGRAVALALGEQGAAVAIGSRTTEEIELVRRELDALEIVCVSSRLDVCQEGSVDAFLALAEEKLGPVDILVNNAGIYRTEAVADHSIDSWREIIDTNLTSAMLTSRRCIKGMVKRNWGRVINISSISGKVAEAFGSAYSASKFGMIGLTQSLALEVAKHGVTVNAVCPGWVDTRMAGDQLSDEKYLTLTEQEPSDAVDIAKLSVPQMRFITTEEVASLVVYLCSEGARGITGQSINICGGLSLH